MRRTLPFRYESGFGELALHRPHAGRPKWQRDRGNTRIAVHDVIGLLPNGETIDTVRTNCFPELTRSQVYECLAYCEDHRGEIDLLAARQMSPPSP